MASAERLDMGISTILLHNVTYNTIIKIESGGSQNPTIDTLSKIAKVLGVSMEDLLK